MIGKQEQWRKRTLLFFLSQCITLFGSQIIQMAIVWHVTLNTNSGAWVAAFSVCSYLPQFVVSFFGGVLADRYSRKRLILAADAWIAAITLVMMLVMPRIAMQRLLLISLLLMSVVRSVGAGVQTPAVHAAIAQLVPQDHRMRYNGINAAMQSAVQFAAPAAAAVVLAVYSLRSTLAIDILTAAIGMSMLACLQFPKETGKRQEQKVLMEMGYGVKYAYGCRKIRNILLIYGLFLFFSVPAGYLAGLHVRRVYGETVWHLTIVELVGFGGMAAGGLLMGLWNGFKSSKRTLAAGLALFGLMAIGMGISDSFVLYLIFMALYGVALTAVQTVITTMLQKATEPSMQGRIFGLMSALYASCYPLGMALFGPLADAVPLKWLMMTSGAALMGLAAVACFDPDLDMD